MLHGQYMAGTCLCPDVQSYVHVCKTAPAAAPVLHLKQLPVHKAL